MLSTFTITLVVLGLFDDAASSLEGSAEVCVDKRCGYFETINSLGNCVVTPGNQCNEDHPCQGGYTCDTTTKTCQCNPTDGKFVQHSYLCVLPMQGDCSCDEDCANPLTCNQGSCGCPFGTNEATRNGTSRCEIDIGFGCNYYASCDSGDNMYTPMCSTGFCGAWDANYRTFCECPLNTVYNQTTKQCACTDPLTSSVQSVFSEYQYDPFGNAVLTEVSVTTCVAFGSATCEKVDHSYSCSCPAGTTVNYDGKVCQCGDPNEVATDAGCVCKSGMMQGTEGKGCVCQSNMIQSGSDGCVCKPNMDLNDYGVCDCTSNMVLDVNGDCACPRGSNWYSTFPYWGNNWSSGYCQCADGMYLKSDGSECQCTKRNRKVKCDSNGENCWCSSS